MADERSQTLDIPEGTSFEFKDGKLIFGHESDIYIRTNLGGYKFAKIFSKHGSVRVLPPQGVEFEVDEIEALEGDVQVDGFVRVQTARSASITFHEGRLTADRLEATQGIVLDGGTVSVLHAKAPSVNIGEKTEGTCLVVESDKPMGPVRVHGGFGSIDEAKKLFDRFAGLGSASSSSGGSASSSSAPATPAASAETTSGQSGKPLESTQEIPAQAIAQAVQADKPAEPTSTPPLPKSSVFRKRK
ncbi:MAG: hypothetical protein AAF533_02635 [Acidobacteriota bacterium]